MSKKKLYVTERQLEILKKLVEQSTNKLIQESSDMNLANINQSREYTELIFEHAELSVILEHPKAVQLIEEFKA